MKSEWQPRKNVEHILAALMPANRLVCLIAMQSGMRVGDVLSLRTEQLRQERFTVQERKTGKRKAVRLPVWLRNAALAQAGQIYAFPHRLDGRKHRTRQAVYKDFVRAVEAFRVRANLTPHSLRKVYAVELLKESGSMAKVQKELNHSDASITAIYALADLIGRT